MSGQFGASVVQASSSHGLQIDAAGIIVGRLGETSQIVTSHTDVLVEIVNITIRPELDLER